MLEFELLQVAIGTRSEFSSAPTADDWSRLFQFAKKQAMIGVLFSAIERLPQEQRPPKAMLMEWFGLAEYIKRQNALLNKRAGEITEKMAADGYRSVVMKSRRMRPTTRILNCVHRAILTSGWMVTEMHWCSMWQHARR